MEVMEAEQQSETPFLMCFWHLLSKPGGGDSGVTGGTLSMMQYNSPVGKY